jgi:hypothetical protein
LITRETVAGDTPATAATVARVGNVRRWLRDDEDILSS